MDTRRSSQSNELHIGRQIVTLHQRIGLQNLKQQLCIHNHSIHFDGAQNFQIFARVTDTIDELIADG